MRPTGKSLLLLVTLCAAGSWKNTLAQVAPASILEIDVENAVQYVKDVSDPLKFGTDSNVTSANVPKGLWENVQIADIVAVNGQPAKGTFTERSQRLSLRPSPNPGESIADTNRNGSVSQSFEILTADGSPIGTILLAGLAGGAPPPGAPLSQTQGNNTIVGGLGAFLGARGQLGQQVTSQTIAARQASITEDPANRRRNGGGRARFIVHVIPMFQPAVIVTSGGPAIAHSSDFTLVTTSKPAAPGEILSLYATGLGPTRPGVDPGRPFPSSPLAAVNSPVDVAVNGKSAGVIAAVGYPGSVDGYQVNFRIPPDTAKGTATIQVSAAWIAGPAVSIPIQ